MKIRRALLCLAGVYRAGLSPRSKRQTTDGRSLPRRGRRRLFLFRISWAFVEPRRLLICNDAATLVRWNGQGLEVSTMADSGAAFWAALAASFSAIASVSIFFVQRQNLIQSIRPEIDLLDVSRPEESNELVFKKIKNIGRGTAQSILINSLALRGTAHLSTIHVPILAAGDEAQVDANLRFYWNNVEQTSDNKTIPVAIKISYLDTSGNRYETRYNLLAFQSVEKTIIAWSVAAPGVLLDDRTTIRKSMRFLKFSAWLQRRITKIGYRYPRFKNIYERVHILLSETKRRIRSALIG